MFPLELKLRLYSKLQPNGCRTWTRSLNGDGYGRLYVDGRYRPAYQLAYNLVKGKVPRGLCLDHTCNNKLCINPDHLEVVTFSENTRRYHARLAKRDN